METWKGATPRAAAFKLSCYGVGVSGRVMRGESVAGAAGGYVSRDSRGGCGERENTEMTNVT